MRNDRYAEVKEKIMRKNEVFFNYLHFITIFVGLLGLYFNFKLEGQIYL